MNTTAFSQNDVNKVSFVVSFEGVHGILVDIQAYVFDASGKLVARQAVRKGRASVSLSDCRDKQVYVVLAPTVDDLVEGAVTLSNMRTFHSFEVKTRLDAALSVYFLPEVPEAVWRWWLVHSLWSGLNRLKNGPSSYAALIV